MINEMENSSLSSRGRGHSAGREVGEGRDPALTPSLGSAMSFFSFGALWCLCLCALGVCAILGRYFCLYLPSSREGLQGRASREGTHPRNSSSNWGPMARLTAS